MGRKAARKEKHKQRKTQAKLKDAPALTLSQKYDFYEKSVQNPEHEVEFLTGEFKKMRSRTPETLREDFCGTGYLMCEWVKQGPKHISYGVDLDPEPIALGMERHYSRLQKEQQKRVHYFEGNVVDSHAPQVDVAVAFNFSYLILKERQELLRYFKKAKEGLKDDGIFFLDLLGGPECMQPMEEATEHDDFTYYWDCQYFNPITHDCRYGIHFKRDGEKKHKNVFTYTWRLYSMPELVDILKEAGFSDVRTYWEEDDEDGEGSGDFYQASEGEPCEAWVTYIAALN